jgi:hypothetical protein
MEGYIIKEGNRPIWQLALAALFFTLSVLLLFLFFSNWGNTTDLTKLKGRVGFLVFSIMTFANGLFFSIVRDCIFDLQKERYKIQYSVGPIRVGKWKGLPEIEYISVFRQLLTNGNYVFETNLWYAQNRHFKIYENLERTPAFEMGKEVAEILKVNLLDATEPNNFKWVDLKPLQTD